MRILRKQIDNRMRAYGPVGKKESRLADLWALEVGKGIAWLYSGVNQIKQDVGIGMMRDIGEIYSLAFTHGRTLERNDQVASFAVVPVGRVSLPSGRIVACDPLTAADEGPFVQAVIPGRYGVDLSLMREEGKGELAAMARVRFTNRQPAVWVMALRRGEKLDSLSPGGYFGYTSDSGTGAFMDSGAIEKADFAHFEDIDELLFALTENYQPHRYWMEYPLDRRLNVVMFSSGKGEGRYASFFGIDADGDVCALVTDFSLLD